jgi:glycosyltransferase involved in cell wall biosynthesis
MPKYDNEKHFKNMNKLSLCIPFYNTSQYFLDCVKYAIEDDFVFEIIVNDDQSTDEEWENINKIISELNIDKIKLYRNPINLGGFKNKYKTIKKASSEWVYLLDSDNYLHDTTLDIIKNIKDVDENICYCPQTLIMFSGNENIERQVNYNFLYDKIGIPESKQFISTGSVDFGMFLNTGNFIVNKEKHLSRMYDAYCNQDPSAACSIAFQYNWMINGGYSKIVPEFKYFHRLRPDSYWVSSGYMSSSKFSYYQSLFCNL